MALPQMHKGNWLLLLEDKQEPGLRMSQLLSLDFVIPAPGCGIQLLHVALAQVKCPLQVFWLQRLGSEVLDARLQRLKALEGTILLKQVLQLQAGRAAGGQSQAEYREHRSQS